MCKKLFCKHDWHLINLTNFKWEEGKTAENDTYKVPIELKYAICCKKCGKIHKKASKMFTQVAKQQLKEKLQ